MIQELINMLKSDPDFYRGWKANIAMAFKDEWDSNYDLRTLNKILLEEDEKTSIHIIANKAADRFLQQLINVPHGT